MKKTIIMLCAAAGLFLASCGNEKAGENGEAMASDSLKTESEAINCGPDMDAFLAMLNGTSEGVKAALDKFGADSLDRQDMDLYMLAEPKVTGCEKADGKEMCVIECKSGATMRTYALRWENGKIAEIEDRNEK